ncbi:60s ribosomal protein l29 [Stemphylium lycopersici]|nr:60s ribosomal protein l29 [Stemphylium lycopersici]
MCGCTLYDSPTCGHSWISMSQPCGFLSDLLSCPYRETYQTLIAPPHTCPVCNGGFADQETIEMVQGPWGCNQMIRNHVGGNYAVPGQWGNARLMPGALRGPAITSGAISGAPMPMGQLNRGFTYDHRLTGPYGPPASLSYASMIGRGPTITGPAMITNGAMWAEIPASSLSSSTIPHSQIDTHNRRHGQIQELVSAQPVQEEPPKRKPKTHRYPSLKGTDPKFRRNHRHALHGTMRALKEVKEGKRENA